MRYFVRRILSVIPVLIGISLISYALGLLTPGDPAMMALSRDGQNIITDELLEQKRNELGLNDPPIVQYLRWAHKALKGDFGVSFSNKAPIGKEMARRLPVTIKLSLSAFVIVAVFGILLGILSAAFAGKNTDTFLKFLTNIMMAVPSFWLSIVFITLFAEKLHWLPTSGMGTYKHMIMPSVTLAMANIAMTERLMRSSMLTQFGNQYMLTADAKGISRVRVLFCHAFPNAVFPVITMLGNYLGGILGGSAIIENMFSLPGIGSYVLDSIYGRDYPVIQAYVLVTGFVFVMLSLAVDLLCVLINPQMRLEK